MTRKLFRLCGTLLVLDFGAFCAGAVSALAAQEPTEEITVYHHNPYTIHRQMLGRPLGQDRLPEERITVEEDVNIADLDLSKPADVDKMNERVRQAAVDSCRELSRQYPKSMYMPVGKEDCVASATTQAVAYLNANRAVVR
jgi:UrcA family protein